MKSEHGFEQVFLGRDNEKLTDGLITELLKSGDLDERMLRSFQKQGYSYCRTRRSFISPLMKLI